jgi:Predicted nucleotidyltransferases
MRFGLPESVVASVQRVLEDHPSVTECLVYGSRAKGSHREGSDIDLVLKGDIESGELDAIELELEELDFPWSIDLSVYGDLDNPALVEHIDRVGRTLWRRGECQ